MVFFRSCACRVSRLELVSATCLAVLVVNQNAPFNFLHTLIFFKIRRISPISVYSTIAGLLEGHAYMVSFLRHLLHLSLDIFWNQALYTPLNPCIRLLFSPSFKAVRYHLFVLDLFYCCLCNRHLFSFPQSKRFKGLLKDSRVCFNTVVKDLTARLLTQFQIFINYFIPPESPSISCMWQSSRAWLCLQSYICSRKLLRAWTCHKVPSGGQEARQPVRTTKQLYWSIVFYHNDWY